MAIPDRQRLKLAVREYFADRKEHGNDDVEEPMARRFHLSDADRFEKQPHGKETRFRNSCRWCTWSLHTEDQYLMSTGRGRWRINTQKR